MENKLKIIRPAHNLPATKARSWKEIKDQALALRQLIIGGGFEGMYSRAYAISHAQVSDEPKWFFVVNETLDDEDGKKLVKKIGSWCVINAEIIETNTAVEWKEACMSFPHRNPKLTDRFLNIKVRYQVPVFGGWFLMWRTKRFEKLIAFMFQHEQEHAIGKNIYGLTNNQK